MAAIGGVLLGWLSEFFKALIGWAPAIAGYVFGRRSKDAKAAKENLKRSRLRHEIEDEVSDLSDDDLDDWL